MMRTLLMGMVGLAGCMRPGEFPTCESEADQIAFDETPTWSDDVAPILHEHCAGCHRPDATGPFPLLEFDEAAPFAGAIASAVVERRMPPAGPTNCGECQSFSNAPWLSDREIALLRDWAAGGAPEGDSAESPVPPPPVDTDLPRVDRTVEMAQDYQPTGSSDDYRCFVVDPEIAKKKFLTGFSVAPGNPDAVHHVILYGLYTTADKKNAKRLQSKDDRPGFRCFGTSGIDNAPMLAAWAPGTPPIVYPQGTGVRLTPNMKLIMQVHYHVEGGDTAPDRSAMNLMLADSVPEEAVVYPIGNYGFEVPPGKESFEDDETWYDFIGPVGDITLHAVAPHMHTAGLKMQVEVGRGSYRECLMDVQHWDFDWQGMYFYEDPVTIRGGVATRVSCTWDSSDRKKWTAWGDGTEDEMCLALFYVTDLPQKRLDEWYGSLQ
jgi:hypothetical protein